MNNNNRYYLPSLKLKIKDMVTHNMKPVIMISKNGKIKDSVQYKSNFNEENIANDIYNSLLECTHDYPERYVYLVGQVSINDKQYILEQLTIHIPEK